MWHCCNYLCSLFFTLLAFDLKCVGHVKVEEWSSSPQEPCSNDSKWEVSSPPEIGAVPHGRSLICLTAHGSASCRSLKNSCQSCSSMSIQTLPNHLWLNSGLHSCLKDYFRIMTIWKETSSRWLQGMISSWLADFSVLPLMGTFCVGSDWKWLSYPCSACGYR